jgi:hypothetical protein
MSQITIFDTSSIMGDVSQLIPDNGTNPVVPTAGGAITVTSTNGINTVGGLNTININIDDNVYSPDTVQTTDATVTTLFSITLNASEAVMISSLVTGAKADYSAAVGGSTGVIARRAAAGSAVLINQWTSKAEDSGTGTPTFAWDVSGNDVRLRVTGEMGITYNWQSGTRYELVTV